MGKENKERLSTSVPGGHGSRCRVTVPAIDFQRSLDQDGRAGWGSPSLARFLFSREFLVAGQWLHVGCQGRMETISMPVYSSGLSGKGALIEETLAVLWQLDRGQTQAEVKTMVVEDDLLGKATRHTREAVWDRIHARYLGDENHARTLARMAVRAPDRQTEKLVLFYEFCRSTPILHDATVACVYPRYAAGYAWMDKATVQQYFDRISATHPELAEWSPQTREKVISNILTILRDFGLLQGTQRKQFARLYVPLPAFVYVLYRLAGEGVTTPRQVLEAGEWKLFFLEQADVVMLLDEATAASHCTFKHQGDVYTLDLRYPSLEACVEALATKVR
jgi:hypothetical protein